MALGVHACGACASARVCVWVCVWVGRYGCIRAGRVTKLWLDAQEYPLYNNYTGISTRHASLIYITSRKIILLTISCIMDAISRRTPQIQCDAKSVYFCYEEPAKNVPNTASGQGNDTLYWKTFQVLVMLLNQSIWSILTIFQILFLIFF